MTDSNFYLGRAYDPISQTVTTRQVTYDPADLTTHAVVTGMTGSGKTGLCVAMLEEAALKFTGILKTTWRRICKIDQVEAEKYIDHCRNQMEEPAFEKAWNEGGSLSLKDAISEIEKIDS